MALENRWIVGTVVNESSRVDTGMRVLLPDYLFLAERRTGYGLVYVSVYKATETFMSGFWLEQIVFLHHFIGAVADLN